MANKIARMSPLGTHGKSLYAKLYKTAFSVNKKMIPFINEAIDAVPYKKEQGPFTFCDYGCSTSHTSEGTLRTGIERVQKRYGQNTEVLLTYSDHPSNDFKSLFQRVHGMEADQEYFHKKNPNVYACAAGTPFHSQVVPSNRVHVGYSVTAAYWLNHRPTCFQNATTHLSQHVSQQEQEVWVEGALKDWQQFLLMRAKELVPGGRFVVVTPVTTPDGEYIGWTRQYKANVFETIEGHWRDMAAEGLITQEEFRQTNWLQFFGTVEQYSRVFADPDSAVSRAGLKLVSTGDFVLPCEFAATWSNSTTKDDSERLAFAEQFSKCREYTLRDTYLSGLSGGRPDEERNSLVDELFRRFTETIAQNPDHFSLDYIEASFVVEKSG